jgi:hypothetical protein
MAEGSDELLLRPLAHVGRADGVHRPVIGLPVRDEGPDADNRVVDVLRELVADGLTNFDVGLARKIVGGCVGKPCLELGIGKASVDLLVELLDDLGFVQCAPSPTTTNGAQVAG